MKPYLIVFISIALIGFVGALSIFAYHAGIPLLEPSGLIARGERDLMIRALLLMLIVVVPLFILIIGIAYRYRATNHKATYTPEWERSVMEEFFWWIIPIEIVLVLGALTWSGTHAFDPERPILSTQKPLVVQVVALPWKWLFIYPEEGVASVNELALPINRPVTFRITADAPMNSFWIPDLGGQMYAMTGMVTNLNLIADHAGTFVGKSANYSGEGFAQMTFAVRVIQDGDFALWIERAKESSPTLSQASFASLAAPSDAGPVRYYGSVTYPFMQMVDASMGSNSTSKNEPMMMHSMH